MSDAYGSLRVVSSEVHGVYCWEDTQGYYVEAHDPEKYIFYPAQFWSHKNHVNLLLAMQLLGEKYGLKLNKKNANYSHQKTTQTSNSKTGRR